MINDINYLMARTELANIVRDPNSFPPFATKGRPEGIEVFLTGRARRLLPQANQKWLTQLPIANETVWNAVATFEHDYREEIGMKDKVHTYHCRRCRLELVLRQIMKQLGDPPA